ncbi:acetyl-CoA carboxylase biotin carboxylase subunit [candidate division KSB1 bacterium]|nr:acetyl-CoA carboxylase biotin carboxylase subunit [candidate division KSB1 bacterium]
MFKKILIANRGEIALRIIRACKELGIKTVAVYSVADADSLHVRFADEGVCIGPPPSYQSYLNVPQIISAAEVTNSDAIHPGYGFLAENAHFAEICGSCKIYFIGPLPDMISKLGDKAFAKKSMQAAGVPVIPGSQGILSDVKAGHQIAAEIGYPVMIKATAGGGGRGIRIVREPAELEKAFQTAQAEAQTAFGNSGLYVEKFIENPRHIEIQILGDNYGNIIALGERDCSIQRKLQKLIEESPSPAVNDQLRTRMIETAVRGAAQVNYRSAGTVEFLLAPDGNFYFMEMNTRIQVEHPVTEMVYDIDLVKEQIRLAAGDKMDTAAREFKARGHAIECRVNAEDPFNGFRPCPGEIKAFHVPGGPGVRVDTHVYAQYRIPPYYDSLLAKVITHGRTRAEALGRMERVFDEFVIEGVKTTIPFHQKVIRDEKFRKGEYNVRFVENFNFR